jgi:hypothetical protein
MTVPILAWGLVSCGFLVLIRPILFAFQHLPTTAVYHPIVDSEHTRATAAPLSLNTYL